MDRIQAAIAQARIAREAVLSGQTPPAEAETTATRPMPQREAPAATTAPAQTDHTATVIAPEDTTPVDLKSPISTKTAEATPPKEAPAAPAVTETETETEEVVNVAQTKRPQHPLVGTAKDRWAALASFVPTEEHLAKNRIVTRESGAKSAPFDVLRTRVLQQMSVQGWSRLAITSPGPGCGKSTVTANLAFSLARQADIRTLVIDLDLRRPNLENLLGLTDHYEISHAIRGTSDLSDQIVRVRDNLAFATTHTAVHDPAELLQGRRISEMLRRAEAQFEPDFILFDLPPMLVSDDTIGFLPNTNCALLVAAAEQSTLGQVDTCEKELAAQTSVLGVVLNKCAHPGDGHGYGYGYGYGYGDHAGARETA